MGKVNVWTAKRIACAVHERGMTLEKLAIRHGRNPASFRHVWKRPNSLNEKIIADFIGIPVETLWPDRYPKDSSRIFDSKKWGGAEAQSSSEAVDEKAA